MWRANHMNLEHMNQSHSVWWIRRASAWAAVEPSALSTQPQPGLLWSQVRCLLSLSLGCCGAQCAVYSASAWAAVEPSALSTQPQPGLLWSQVRCLLSLSLGCCGAKCAVYSP